LKTKNFHWHMSGVHFRDYHLLLDEHAEQIFAMSDDIAERARKIGAPVQKLGVGHIRQVEERNECFRTLLSAGAFAAVSALGAQASSGLAPKRAET
jgi:hypothetical protein